jgi:hypothetical protein
VDKLEAELNRELRRLQIKYRAGFDILRVEWRPTNPSLCPKNDKVDSENAYIGGECVNDPVNMTRWYIIVYEQEDEDMALHTVRHEFIEHIITKPTATFVKLSNVLIKLINELQYETQEDVVEAIAKMEDEEYEQIKKRAKKD